MNTIPYNVRPNETPRTIADRFGVTVPQLLATNPHKPRASVGGQVTFQTLSVGEPLNIPSKARSCGCGCNGAPGGCGALGRLPVGAPLIGFGQDTSNLANPVSLNSSAPASGPSTFNATTTAAATTLQASPPSSCVYDANTAAFQQAVNADSANTTPLTVDGKYGDNTSAVLSTVLSTMGSLSAPASVCGSSGGGTSSPGSNTGSNTGTTTTTTTTATTDNTGLIIAGVVGVVGIGALAYMAHRHAPGIRAHVAKHIAARRARRHHA